MTNPGAERVYFDPPEGVETSWWQRYEARLSHLTPTARAVLQADCGLIVERGLFGDGEPAEDAWPSSRTRTGLVMGSVQSGKTASMFGVAALALDRRVDILVVLAGTRLSLWRQTYERLAEQLDSGENGADKATRRVLCPAPGIVLSDAQSSLSDTYRLGSAQARRKLAQERPIIFVAMKQANHLYALGNTLRNSAFDAISNLDRPVHMLVLDDEADDGSILDAAVEAGQDPLSPTLKQIPRAIADLWDPRSTEAPPNLFTSYVGYTATPQANLLQEDHNPLAPRDFVFCLRTPLDMGDPVEPFQDDAPRSSTYPEPTGLDDYYIGGEVFYRRGVPADLCIDLGGQADEDLADAIRSFLVAGAIILHRSQGATGPNSLLEMDFDTSEQAEASSPPPHSMLFHPSAAIEEHFASAEDVLLWAGAEDRASARRLLDSGDARLPDGLIVKLLAEEPLWKVWVDRFRDSLSEITDQFNVITPRTIPDWPSLKQLLIEEVIPGTRISVVNSDPNADDRPNYKPLLDGSIGRWRAARDLSTIFVSGNVMARGLTLEGLTTTLFRRAATSPIADTQMQMQRWFGYRGKNVELCRLFASRAQIDLFAAYHEIDEAVRTVIARNGPSGVASPSVLHGRDFLATGKIANLARLPLCSSAKPFVTLINSGERPDPNLQVLADLFGSDHSSDVVVGERVRGRALDRTFSLAEAAAVLDDLRYDDYHPGIHHRLAELWSQVQSRVSAVYPLAGETQLYKAPDAGGVPTPVRPDCPYAIPAYLRLWDACLTRSVRGLFVTGSPTDLWSMADLAGKSAQQPRFTIGIRYGAGGRVNASAIAGLDFDIFATTKSVGTNGELETEWGTNNPTAGPLDYRGDEFFDYYHRGEQVPRLTGGTPWRPAGSAGQILFYVNQPTGQANPSVAVGVCIPAGGPEQFAATRAGARFAAQ